MINLANINGKGRGKMGETELWKEPQDQWVYFLNLTE